MPEAWVVSQHRTMARWISSKVETTVSDVTKDLCDGLVLVELVNCIAVESGASRFVLTPVYSKPNFHIQKVENVDDMLQYCRLVLQLNTCNISAENVVGGDLKLILGLIWTLFVFSSSRLISLQNDGRSIGEIKAILLAWLNNLGRRKALLEITNFNKDWSLQRERRVDLVFASILDVYIPDVIRYSEYVQGRKLANLHKLVGLACDLGIPDLAVAEDFNVLVPEEKCVIFYVLQWYTFFEMSEAPETTAEEKEHSISEFISEILDTVKVKHRYETRALRLVNQINTNACKLRGLQNEGTLLNRDLPTQLDFYCAEVSGSSADISLQLTARGDFAQISESLVALKDILKRYEHFKVAVRPVFVYHDFPEVQALSKTIRNSLKHAGVPGYQPIKMLGLDALASRLQLLTETEKELGEALLHVLDQIRTSRLSAIDTLLSSLEKGLQSHAVPASTKKFVENIDWLVRTKNDLDYFHAVLRQNHTTSDLRALFESLETMEVPLTPETPGESGFFLFKHAVLQQSNRANLTYSDVRHFLKCMMHDQRDLKDFLLLVPSRRLLPRSESDDFTGYSSEESDDSRSIFDDAQRKLEHKLSGNYNKLYDLGELVARLENGFLV